MDSQRQRMLCIGCRGKCANAAPTRGTRASEVASSGRCTGHRPKVRHTHTTSQKKRRTSLKGPPRLLRLFLLHALLRFDWTSQLYFNNPPSEWSSSCKYVYGSARPVLIALTAHRELPRVPKDSYYDKYKRPTAALYRARQPFLIRNALTGLCIVGFVAGVCESPVHHLIYGY